MHPKSFIPRISNRLPSNASITTSESGRQISKHESLNNISFEGLSFESQMEYRKGAIISIDIPIARPAFKVTAEIIWCKNVDGNYQVGVKFLQIQSGYRMKMLEQLSFIESYRKKVYFDENRSLSCEQAYTELKNYFRYQQH